MGKQKKIKDKLPKQVILNAKIDKSWDWIPFGVTLNKKGKQIPIGWYLNDLGTINEKVFNTYPSSSLLISGGTGSGKSYLVRNIINHIDKFSDNFQLLGVDIVQIEYLDILDKFTCMASDIKSAVSVISSVQAHMMTRFKLMQEHNINNIYKLNDKQITVPYYIINGKQYQFDEFVTIKVDMDKEDSDYARLIKVYPDGKRIYIMPIDNVYKSLEEKTFDKVIINDTTIKLSDIKKTEGIYKFKDIVLVLDNFSEIMLSDDYKAIDMVKQAVGSIARLGRASGIHLIICCQRPGGSVISTDLRNNINMRVLLGGFDDGIS
ncbi:MAG: FtsK/SpoIIIE domain-containing protein, partial [Bacilli bacterium]|nr:FtsK/SpoIIIE domain-containing protein [Bacilli bacterium]